MKRTGWSALASVGAGVSLMAWVGTASASSGLDSPDSGVVQGGRGSAALARSDDPLAAYFNPAAMAFQASGVHLGAQALFPKKCYTRLGLDGKPVTPDAGIPAPGAKADPALGTPAGPKNPEVCGDTHFFPNPQLGATFRITNRFAIGVAVVAPHAAGKTEWPESLEYTGNFGDLTQPAPQRYLLISADSIIVNPTISVAFAPTDNLSFGAGFIWGIASVKFTNFTELVSPPRIAGDIGDHAVTASGDIRASINAKDLIIPGFVLSALWMPTKNLDVAAWFKWQDALKASTNLDLESKYWKASGARNDAPCVDPEPKGCNITKKQDAGTIKFAIPMEAKIGLRYHHARAPGGPQPSWITKNPERKIRDPLSEDLFDLELDFTWANNSVNENLELRFKKDILVNGAGGGKVPLNGDIPHKWKDVVGVRLGGDFVAIPNRLAVRAGGWFETQGVDASYLNLDFNLAAKGGVSGGATVRVGPVDISAMYQHTFYATLDNGGKGNVHALSGDASTDHCPIIDGVKTCSRSQLAVNGGVLKSSIDEFGLAGTIRW